MPRITQRCRERQRAEQRSHFSSVPISAQDRLFLSLSQAPQPGEAKSLEAEAVMHFARQMILAHVALGRALVSLLAPKCFFLPFPTNLADPVSSWK